MPADYVLLHGGGQGSWVWDETLAALARQSGGSFGRALALDVPGCGTKRGRDTSAIGMAEIAAELIADIEASGISDALLVGHSQAGTVLPLLLEARPDLFRRVVYVSALAPAGHQSAMDWRAEMPAAESAYELGAEPTPERFRAMFCNDMSGPQADAFMAKLGEDAWPSASYGASGWRYDHLGAPPASYVLCLRDATLAPAWQELFAKRLKAERLIRIDAGHQVMNTRPHALAEVLRCEAAEG
jgi:pimeloyl-ACP methyl ester carboxylesterase